MSYLQLKVFPLRHFVLANAEQSHQVWDEPLSSDHQALGCFVIGQIAHGPRGVDLEARVRRASQCSDQACDQTTPTKIKNKPPSKQGSQNNRTTKIDTNTFCYTTRCSTINNFDK